MTSRHGQATIEWVAVLIVAATLAGGIAVGTRGTIARFVHGSSGLDVIAAAGFQSATSPQLPVLGADALPTIAGDSIVIVASKLAVAGIAEMPPGSNRGWAIDAFTDGNAEAWCADFVSWVLRAAGYPFSGGASRGWRLAWTGDVRSYFVARGAYRDRLQAQPHPGDVVWFVHGHVGIVTGVRGDALTTIEGNSDNAVRARTYPHWRLDSDIGGFGRPGVVGGVAPGESMRTTA